MDPNIVLGRAPSSVKVGGAPVSIATSFRAGIRAMQAADDPDLGDAGRAQAILLICPAPSTRTPPVPSRRRSGS